MAQEKKAAKKGAPKAAVAKPAAKASLVEKKPRGEKRKRSPEEKAFAKRKARILAKERIWFRGRFGKKSIWRKGKEKWQKWRRPRGIDIHRTQEDGRFVKIGRKLPSDIRGCHPSGFREVLVRNISELKAGDAKNFAVRISGSLGAKKRKQVFLEAKKMGFKILN